MPHALLLPSCVCSLCTNLSLSHSGAIANLCSSTAHWESPDHLLHFQLLSHFTTLLQQLGPGDVKKISRNQRQLLYRWIPLRHIDKNHMWVLLCPVWRVSPLQIATKTKLFLTRCLSCSSEYYIFWLTLCTGCRCLLWSASTATFGEGKGMYTHCSGTCKGQHHTLSLL